MFGAAFPDELYTNAGKYTGAANYNLMIRHLHDIAGGAILTAPSMSDLENPEVGHLARKYMSTGPDVDGEYRTRLFHAIRDLTADAYGGGRSESARRKIEPIADGSRAMNVPPPVVEVMRSSSVWLTWSPMPMAIT